MGYIQPPYPGSVDVSDRSARLLGHVTVDSAPTTAVTGTFWQATQPVSATSLPLPTGAAQDGTDGTGITAPTGATGIRGWLSGIYKAVTGTLKVDGSAVTQPVSGTVAATQGSDPWKDHYTTGQMLADQAGAGGVLTYTFSKTMNLVVVFSNGGVSRADPVGGTPSATQGVYCDNGSPSYITVDTASVKVYAPNGATVSVWGFSYA